MPQLDFTNYLSQTTWFFICFVTFYLINIYYVIPSFSLSKKIRKISLFILSVETFKGGTFFLDYKNNNTKIITNNLSLLKTATSYYLLNSYTK
uniref:ATP synthase F0 subunit 8 n=1 Tax=Cyanophora biloba TaxID=1489483 RepID=A0A873WUT5_9EUKA|nr:ATP synthase F0 subunit 8 [Cyanophora biloba]QPB15034.1 ATP synthase F0 subunit 8 [Cyanophora biloba]